MLWHTTREVNGGTGASAFGNSHDNIKMLIASFVVWGRTRLRKVLEAKAAAAPASREARWQGNSHSRRLFSDACFMSQADIEQETGDKRETRKKEN
jgi:hypothetical protein